MNFNALMSKINKVAADLVGVTLGQISDNTLTDVKLSNTSGNIKDKVSNILNSDFLRVNKSGLVAHAGGLKTYAPENTVEAIRKAGEFGYEVVEIDLAKTSDGVLILMHDATVDRTTNGTGTVTALTYSYISGLLVDITYAGKTTDDVIRVPTFEQAVYEASKYGLALNLDCTRFGWTEAIVNQVVDILKKYNIFHKSVFMMSEDSDRNLLTSLYPFAIVGWTSSDVDPTANINKVNSYKNAFIAYTAVNMTDGLYIAYKNANVPVYVYSCNAIKDVNLWKGKARWIETDYVIPERGDYR